MDIALITGGDNIIVQSIGRKLITLGFRVYVFIQSKQSISFTHKDFIIKVVDFQNFLNLEQEINVILKNEQEIHTFIHVTEKNNKTDINNISSQNLIKNLHINFLAPIYLIKLSLPSLKNQKGHIINICWSDFDPINQASSDGLKSFSKALFENIRNTGIKITTIYPLENKTKSKKIINPYNSPQSVINPELISDAIEKLIRSGEGNVITHMEIRPQSSQEIEALAKLKQNIDEYNITQSPLNDSDLKKENNYTNNKILKKSLLYNRYKRTVRKDIEYK